MTRPTGRDLEILTLVAAGLTKREIGRQLYITEPTVKTHLAHTYDILGARNAAHAVALALTAGLIALPQPGELPESQTAAFPVQPSGSERVPA